ncbi:MAG: hypothetical protein IKG27_04045 [Bacilli bacterium]|nr:hypothetical protein [Bacilli bacterium]
MILDKESLLKISGGYISATLINAIVKGVTMLMELGKSLGSTIRRVTSNKPCGI